MKTSRRLLLLAAAAAVLPARAGLPPPELRQAQPGLRLHGEGKLRFLGLAVYDIRLWTPTDFAPERWAEAPIALEIQYARALVGKAIAERSLLEMRRQGDVPAERAERWLAQMEQLFPDVKQGDRILGVKQPGVGASFYVNGRLRGEVRDADFARRFFGIWLAPQSSEPGLRQRLLGGPS
jgi:Chalcone isomerase-like